MISSPISSGEEVDLSRRLAEDGKVQPASHPLRVLLITEASAAGVGRHVIDLADGLAKSGHRVWLVYSQKRCDELFRQGIGGMVGVTAHRLDMRRAPHWSDMAAISAVRRFVHQHGPFDVVHGHSSKGGVIARLLKSPHVGSIVYTPHCMYTQNERAGKLISAVTLAVEKSLVRKTDAIIAVSEDEREHMLASGFPGDRVHCILNGIDELLPADRPISRCKLATHPKDVVVGFLGRLSSQKNPALLLRALSESANRDRVRLAMVGTGDLTPKLQRLSSDLGIADRVMWLGYHTAAEFLPAIDIFALPSDYEGMPYVLLEALAAGLPIVATKVGGVRHVVQPGENGFIIPPGDVGAMARAIDRLVESPQLRQVFAENSLHRLKLFSQQVMVDQTVALYRQIANTKHAEDKVLAKPRAS